MFGRSIWRTALPSLLANVYVLQQLILYILQDLGSLQAARKEEKKKKKGKYLNYGMGHLESRNCIVDIHEGGRQPRGGHLEHLWKCWLTKGTTTRDFRVDTTLGYTISGNAW